MNDLASRAIIQSILANPSARDTQSLLRKEIDANIVLPAYSALGLDEILYPDTGVRTAEVCAAEKVQAVQAVMAAAYLSYKCNGIVLARHLPSCIRGWLDTMAQVVSEIETPDPATSARHERPSRSSGTGQGKQAGHNNTSKPADEKPEHDGQGGLVLTRKPGQEILLGDDIVIQVSEVIDRKVKIRIKAPRELNVLRAELRERGFS